MDADLGQQRSVLEANLLLLAPDFNQILQKCQRREKLFLRKMKDNEDGSWSMVNGSWLMLRGNHEP
jgi:hypothetical protein